MTDDAKGTTPQSVEGIRVAHDGATLRLTFDRPKVRNAVTGPGLNAMADAIAAVVNDDSTRVIVLDAIGDHFCSGIDLPAVNERGESRPRTGHVRRGISFGAHRLITAMWESQLPVVAAVRGYAAGVGCNLALAADFVVASETARFSEPFVRRALTPDSGATFLLPRLIGVARAKDVLMLGEVIDGRTAAAWGLVTRVVGDEELESVTDELAQRLATGPTVALGMTKSLIHRALESTLAQALEQEATVEDVAVRSPDFKEGLRAFVEKRDPEFGGR